MPATLILFCVLAASATEPVVIPAPPAVPLPAPPATEPAPPATEPAPPATAPPPAQEPPPPPPATEPAPPANPPPAYPAPTNAPPAYPPGAYPAPQGYAPAPGYPPPGYPGYPGYPYPYGYTPPRAPGAETHDGGYIRLQLGVNWSGLSAKASGNTVEYDGSGASFAAAFGFSVAPHLILYGELLAAGAADADIKQNGGTAEHTTLGTNVLGIGPGAASYFGSNLFIAATLLFATAQITDNNGNVLTESRTGLALEMLFGKEWWVSDNWGLGLSGQVILGQMKGKDVDQTLLEVPTWSAKSFSLLFSSTYN